MFINKDLMMFLVKKWGLVSEKQVSLFQQRGFFYFLVWCVFGQVFFSIGLDFFVLRNGVDVLRDQEEKVEFCVVYGLNKNEMIEFEW